MNFTLNMDTTTLILTFNETVNASSLRVDQISIQHNVQSSPDYNSSSRSLTPGEGETFTVSDNDYIIAVNLGPLDRNEIKKRRGLATSADTTYLTAAMSAITDMSGNPLTAIVDGRAQQTVNFLPDSTPPVITNFTMDMDLGRFILTFDETVMASSLMRSSIYFQDAQENATIWHLLSGRGSHTLEDSTVITVTIQIDDLNEIKRLTLCREQEACFLVHEAATVLDMVNNPITSRGDGSALPPSVYLPDITSPTLLRFETNLTSEIISLTFDETVNASSINFTAFTLQDFFQASSSYTLTDGTLLSTDSTVAMFMLNLVDLNAIKKNTDIFVNRFSSWLTLTEYAIQDLATSPNNVVPILDTDDLTAGLVSAEFYPDLVSPELVDFDLNLTSEELTLYFTETVLARSLRISGVTLQNRMNRNEATEWHVLQMGDLPLLSELLSNEDQYFLTISLGRNDTNIIKALSDMATDVNNTFISITSELVGDMNENPVTAISIYEAKRVRSLFGDFIRPELDSFYLDIDAGQIVLMFDETVNASSLQVQNIRIQSTIDGSSTIFWNLTPPTIPNITLVIGSGMGSGGSSSGSGSGLMSGSGSGLDMFAMNETANETSPETDRFAPYHSFTNGPNRPILFIQLGFTDLNMLKRLTDLATDTSDTFLSLTPEAIADMSGNPVMEVPANDALSTIRVDPDITPPNLIMFDLNLTSEVLSLTFDEVVNAASLRAESVTLQESALPPLVMIVSRYMLTGGNGSRSDDYVIDIKLDTEDLNQIKRLEQIATSRENTYLTILPSLVVDMNDNRVEGIERGLQVSTFYGDFVRPELSSFHLDMNQGVLYLTFTETVNASSFDVSQIVLQDSAMTPMNGRRPLSRDSSLQMLYNDPVISIQLGIADLNFIKATEMFGLSTVDTWIAITDELVLDMNANPVQPILETAAQMARDFTEDTTRPLLIEYHLDFILEEMTLSFDEPMNVSMINFTSITLQDDIDADDTRTLTGGSPRALNNSLVIIIAFNEQDIDFFKMHPSLTTSTEDTFISFTMDAFYDLATVPNPVIPVINGHNATQVSTFVYYQPPIFTAIRPIAGRESGGTTVVITGGNFGNFINETGERDVEVLIDSVPVRDVVVLEFNVSVEGFTPPAGPDTPRGEPLNLTITIDNSVLMVNITEVYTYLAPPSITRVFPVIGSQIGSTLIAVYGSSFGPVEYGPEVRVQIGASMCENITILNDTTLTCVTPPLNPGVYSITVTVDEVPATFTNAFTAMIHPTVETVFPVSAYRDTPTYINITGTRFGPTTQSRTAHPIQVQLVSQFNTTECSEPIVLVEGTLISCLAQPGLGPSAITVTVDRVDSLPSNATFIHYDDAGSFSFENSGLFTVSESEYVANVSVTRFNNPLFPSPVSVSVQAFNGTAESGSHFEASNQTVYLDSEENIAIFQVRITFQDFQPENLRKGSVDDVEINLLITEVLPLHPEAEAEIAEESGLLRIKALCQIVNHVCVADWNVLTNEIAYFRVDEL